MNQKQNPPLIKGFSKLSRSERIATIAKLLGERDELAGWLDAYQHPGSEEQQLFSRFSENYLTDFHLPFGVVPNVVVNNHHYIVPMVIEESSVVAAAAKAAGFWARHGGFHARLAGTERRGQVHFTWSGGAEVLSGWFSGIRNRMLEAIAPITKKMEARGGGITKIELLNKTSLIENYYQIDAAFETADAMGANFINTCLEQMAEVLNNELAQHRNLGQVEVVMSILSNYTPMSLVECWVEAPVEVLASVSGSMPPEVFAQKFVLATQIAGVDVSRAVTHNKGIYNGVDAVVLATGNDWRAVEACGHAYAAADGNYRSLSRAEVFDGIFKYTLYLPLAVGTVGGLTRTHPQARLAMEIMGHPNVEELMMVAAATGLANNFSAVAALITSGIQQGHMKMHLPNILQQLGCTKDETEKALHHFKGKQVSHAAVGVFIDHLRSNHGSE